MSWTEVADGLFVRRYQPLDVNVCVVRGSDGLLVVDTRSSPRQADELRADLRQLGAHPVRCVVNTHAHFDHCFGNQRFGPASDLNVPIYGHELMPRHLDTYERPMLQTCIAKADGPVDEWREVVITPPTRLVGAHRFIDLGDRAVELMHLGRGHTDNDLVLHVPDANAWLVGDLIEESGPPMYDPGCFPLEWPKTVAALTERLQSDDIVLPGHGSPVDPSFVRAQLDQLRLAAEAVAQAHDAGLTRDAAMTVAAERWPFTADSLRYAVAALDAPEGGG